MDTVRIFLHIMSASVWVGGQIAIGAVLPTARSLGDDAPHELARAFARVSWPAYGVAVVTGLWNVALIPLDQFAHPWVELKVIAVAISGGGAAAHQLARGNRSLVAAGGAIALAFGIVSMYLGLLAGPVG